MKTVSFMTGNAQMKNKLLIVYTLERLLKTMTFSEITVKKLIADPVFLVLLFIEISGINTMLAIGTLECNFKRYLKTHTTRL